NRRRHPRRRDRRFPLNPSVPVAASITWRGPGMIAWLAATTAASRRGVGSVADDERSASGVVPGLGAAFADQLRAGTEGLQGLVGLGQRGPLAPGVFPQPDALSAAQMTSIADSIAAQRSSIEALQAQLSSLTTSLQRWSRSSVRSRSGAL